MAVPRASSRQIDQPAASCRPLGGDGDVVEEEMVGLGQQHQNPGDSAVDGEDEHRTLGDAGG